MSPSLARDPGTRLTEPLRQVTEEGPALEPLQALQGSTTGGGLRSQPVELAGLRLSAAPLFVLFLCTRGTLRLVSAAAGKQSVHQGNQGLGGHSHATQRIVEESFLEHEFCGIWALELLDNRWIHRL